MLKRLVYVLPIVVLMIVGVLAGSFWLVPTDRLNGVIARQLSDAFGYQVALSGRPSVSLYPFLKVSFGPLQVTARDTDARPLMTIERASGRLSTKSLWGGKPALRYIDLERAQIFLSRDAGGKPNWTAARFFSPEDRANANPPQLKFPKKLKRITFIDSRITIADPHFDNTQTFTNFEATITGPPRSSDFSVSGSAQWRGERIEGSASISEPAAFLTGNPGKARINVSSRLIDAAFQGQLMWSDYLRGDGTLEATIHSAAGLSEWLGLKGGAILPDRPLQLVGDGIFTTKQFDFRPIGIRFDNARADGRLALDLGGSQLGLAGTLAFDRLVFDENGAGENRAPSILETLLSTGQSGARLDLRVSADAAKVAGHEMKNMAIGIILKEPTFLLNIGSAQIMDIENAGVPASHLSGEIAIAFEGEKKRAKAKMTFNNMTMSTIARATGVPLPLDGRAMVSVQLDAEGESARAMEDTLGVQIAADIQNGALNALNLGALVRAHPPFNSQFINNDALKTAFKRARLIGSANASGILDISELKLESEALNVVASGRVDIGGNQLSMLGRIVPSELSPTVSPFDVSFTLGGLLSRPRVSSVNGILVPASGNTQ